MKQENRPLYVRLSPEERDQFDRYCENVNVNYSIVLRAMIKDCLERISKGEQVNLMLGVMKLGRPKKDS